MEEKAAAALEGGLRAAEEVVHHRADRVGPLAETEPLAATEVLKVEARTAGATAGTREAAMAGGSAEAGTVEA